VTYDHQVPRTLHDEHLATLGVLDKLEGLLARRKRSQPPAASEPASAEMIGSFLALVDQEVRAHFRFEEEQLFPLLAERGEADIGGLLSEEHAAILPVGERMATLARAARREGFSAAAWDEFHRLGVELIERLVSHVQKEEMALLPMLEDLLDAEADARLADGYAMTR
jgi:iron-sulfur cluster repair protein YtfE (RIC family)